jgi:hypothetical protein
MTTEVLAGVLMQVPVRSVPAFKLAAAAASSHLPTCAGHRGCPEATVDQSAKAMKDAEIEAENEDFLESFNQPTYPRHADQRAAGRYLSSKHGWSRDSRPEAEWINCIFLGSLCHVPIYRS